MAAISSQILSQLMTKDPIQQNSANQQINIEPLAPLSDQNLTNETTLGVNTLQEIQAIQQAILEEDFDFSTLEATAAGNNADQAQSPPGEKTLSSPVLLQDDDLLISFRHDSGMTRAAQINEASIDTRAPSSLSERPEFNETLAFEAQENPDALPNSAQVSGFLSEDFVTRTQGSFDAELAIPEQSITTDYGNFISSSEGLWSYQLDNSAVAVQSLAAGQTVTDRISLTNSSGEAVELIFSIQGNNDQALITGQKTGSIQALPLSELPTDQSVISGKLSVSDIDNAEASFNINTSLKGNFGSAEINALGEWRYTLNNDLDAVQGLKSGEKLFDLFSVKTLDGSKQLIQISIEGVDDKPLLGGNNLAILDLETQLDSNGSLTISDPDFGESTFQEASGIISALGYGEGSINAQGQWQFTLDTDFTQANPIAEGESRVDSFEVFTADGTSQTILIPIQGSNQPLYSQAESSAEALQLGELISNADILDDFNTLDAHQQTQHQSSQAAESMLSAAYTSDTASPISPSHSNDIGLI